MSTASSSWMAAGSSVDGTLRDVFYDNSAMEAAGLVPPQTVRFAGHVPALGVARPLGPDDLAAMLGARLEVA